MTSYLNVMYQQEVILKEFNRSDMCAGLWLAKIKYGPCSPLTSRIKKQPNKQKQNNKPAL